MAMAAGIYQKTESDTAVELSNLPADDSYQELIKAPAPVAAPEPAAKGGAPVPVTTSVAAEAARQRALAVRRTVRSVDDVDHQAGTDDQSTGAAPAALANGRPEGESPSAAVASAVASSGLAAASPASNQSTAGAAPAAAVGGTTATASAGSTGNTAAVTPVAQSTAGQVLDSPDLLAARLAQYRSLMVNEAAQAQFLPPNPAVVRRYLMVNRSTYMSQ
jgi:hypothetical protein